MALKKRDDCPEWSAMTTIEKAEYCEKIAAGYGDGFCKDQVLAQAGRLREMAGQGQAAYYYTKEKENNYGTTQKG